MPFPNSPFKENFNREVLCTTSDKSPHATIQNIELDKTLKWLCTFPKCTTYRVNTLKTTVESVKLKLKQHIDQVLGDKSIELIVHPLLPDVLVLKHPKVKEKFVFHDKEVIIDCDCATAVLRGAHIFAPGVMGMISGTQIGEKVSIYADVAKKCKKGLQKTYTEGEKIFVGNGVAKMQRHELFGENLTPSGIAIEVTETISGCPAVGDKFLEDGLILLQNLPSTICVHNLSPNPGEVILDMCASPGNKTTHIAALLKNEGNLIALDKTPSKVVQLKKRCDEFNAKVVIHQADSTKICDDLVNSIETGPPFKPDSFDKVLLDAPCSALGKRPQLLNTSSEKVIRSYVPLQRKLFETAVKLLKPGGTLVYSTCTLTVAENEGIVAWALKSFNCLQLIPQKIYLGGQGWNETNLTEQQRMLVQRFGCDDDVDSVGFFIACFKKS